MLGVTEITRKAQPQQILEYPQQRYRINPKIVPGSFVRKASTSSQQEGVPLLFQPFTVKDLVLPNRILVAPMCTDSSEDGFTSDFHLVNVGAWSLHGAGLIIMEATAVTEFGRITPGDIGLYRDEHIPGVKRIVDFVHDQGGKIGVQLAHAGRKVH
jgi:2,4-dienoyl-CoA reductase-like NADH-dependent reductase (Old Yellow Enzyme family)